jgi:hypothetical protein
MHGDGSNTKKRDDMMELRQQLAFIMAELQALRASQSPSKEVHHAEPIRSMVGSNHVVLNNLPPIARLM